MHRRSGFVISLGLAATGCGTDEEELHQRGLWPSLGEMFSIFRRKAQSRQPMTFNQRLDSFWTWYRKAGPRFFQTIESGKCASLADEVSTQVATLLPGFMWTFGPGAGGIGHSFTLTGEGNFHKQLLALHWLSRAPVMDGWTFYAARQPGPIKGHVIEMEDLKFDPKEIWVTPSIDRENERIDITVWHPARGEAAAAQQSTVTFLFLDEALGEYGTERWIGRIDRGKDKLANAFPLEELAGFVATTAREQGWKDRLPGGTWTLFSSKKAAGDFPRGDTITQNTCVPQLFEEFMHSAGEYSDPLADTGADYVYVSIDRSFFPKGEEAHRRGEIEDAIGKALVEFDGGRCVGGALGTERSYSDFLIFDGDRSLQAIQQVLRQQRVSAGTMIEYFAREKRGQRIAL